MPLLPNFQRRAEASVRTPRALADVLGQFADVRCGRVAFGMRTLVVGDHLDQRVERIALTIQQVTAALCVVFAEEIKQLGWKKNK